MFPGPISSFSMLHISACTIWRAGNRVYDETIKCITYLLISQYLSVVSLLALTTMPIGGSPTPLPLSRSCTDSTLSSWPLNCLTFPQSDVDHRVITSPALHTTHPYSAQTHTHTHTRSSVKLLREVIQITWELVTYLSQTITIKIFS